MTEHKGIKTLGDGHIVWYIWCAFCKATKDVPDDCDYCFRAISITVTSGGS